MKLYKNDSWITSENTTQTHLVPLRRRILLSIDCLMKRRIFDTEAVTNKTGSVCVALSRVHFIIRDYECARSYLSYLVCKSHLFCAVFYCHLCPVWLYCVFPLYLIKGKIYGEKVIPYKVCVLIFPCSFSVLILRNI